jgi:hypothetical protein
MSKRRPKSVRLPSRVVGKFHRDQLLRIKLECNKLLLGRTLHPKEERADIPVDEILGFYDPKKQQKLEEARQGLKKF